MIATYQAAGRTMLGTVSPVVPIEQTRFLTATDRYALMDAYYAATPYGDQATLPVRAERVSRALPRSIRAITTAPKRAVDWWPGHLYPKGEIPYDLDETNPELLAAWTQSMRWGGWERRQLLSYAKRQTLYGNVFAIAEVADDLSEVYPRLVHPRYLIDLEVNARQDVQAYEVAIPRERILGPGRVEAYTWHRRVDKLSIREWESRMGAVTRSLKDVDNPWGFVPAVWEEHQDAAATDQNLHGEGRLDGLLGVFDELNGLLTAGHDFLHKLNRQTTLVATDNPTALAQALTAPSANETLSDAEYVHAVRRDRARGDDASTVIPVGKESRAFPLLSNLGLGDGDAWVGRLIEEVVTALPELQFGKDLGGVRELGIRALIEGVEHDLNATAGNADRGLVKLAGMCAGMMGELVASGSIPILTNAHEPFQPFNLGSYDRGELTMSMLPREVLPLTLGERAEEAKAFEGIRTYQGLVHAGFDREAIFGPRIEGETDQDYETRTAPRGILDDLQSRTAGAGDVFATALAQGVI